jgi:hypothetical protein
MDPRPLPSAAAAKSNQRYRTYGTVIRWFWRPVSFSAAAIVAACQAERIGTVSRANLRNDGVGNLKFVLTTPNVSG